MASRLKVALPLLCAAALVLASLPLAEPTHAATITVNTPNDAAGVSPATCTLRAAIAAAVNPGDTIMFQAGLASPIILGSELAINQSITISGPGAATLAVSGSNASRVFDIGNMFPSTVTISGLTIQNGLAPSPGGTAPGTGGAILVGLLSSLTLSNATVTASRAANASGGTAGGQGGGIFVAGSATLNTVTVSSNTASGPIFGGQGGGIHVAAGGSATLNDSTVGNTNAANGGSGFGGQGGGVFVTGGLTLNNTTVRGNTAGAINNGGGGQGGGISIDAGGSATLSGSTVSGNTAAGAANGISGSQGGGIFNRGTLMLNSSSVGIMGSGNTATNGGPMAPGPGAAGGGIFNSVGTATLTNANVSDNTAQATAISAGSDGGIFNSAGTTLTLTGVTINMNLAGGTTGPLMNGSGGVGGGIDNGGTANLTNVTISTNSATASTGATTSNPGGSGGGLFNGGGTATLLNVTVTQNLATPGSTAGTGGGIDRTGGTVNLKNSIVENNGPTNCAGTIASQGDNLSQGTSCGLTATDINNPNNPDLLLGPLQLNPPNPPVAPPGNNLTVALLPGSPAIDGVTHNACPPPATDERGVPRPQGPRCDIGAFEVQVILTPTPTSTATPILTATPTPTSTPTSTPCILGDINCDGIVDIRDYGVWRQQFGQQGAGLSADLNQDGIVDIRDYGIWRANFGRTAGAPLRGEPAPAPRGTPGLALLAGDQGAARSWAPLPADGSVPAVPVIPLVGGLLGLSEARRVVEAPSPPGQG